MFPRIKKNAKTSGTYEYLVVSESVRDSNGRSTTKDVATLGNISKFDKDTVANLIDGLIRLFEIEQYGLADQVEILESLEYGNIVLWRTLWNRMRLAQTVAEEVERAESRITIDVAKYVELMVINRCVNPLSKLATSRWMDTTCYAALDGYAALPREVEYFYRSMDYLLKAKDQIEKALFERLRNLFSINVRLTFYDITSTFFYSDACPLAHLGLSRDKRPDREQVVIGVLTSYEGYPLKHYVFRGNTKDETTVGEVVRRLKQEYEIEETTFVGDRGMISKLNLERIEAEQFDYIMGVKHRQDEMMAMVLEDDRLFVGEITEWKGLKITDRRIRVQDFVLWKTARLLQLSRRERQTKAWREFAAWIARLDAAETVDSARARELCDALAREDSATRAKVTRLLSKYRGRGEETIRVVCALNPERAELAEQQRQQKIASLSKELDKVMAGTRDEQLELRLERVFEGHNRRYRRFFIWQREQAATQPVGYHTDKEAIAAEHKHDGVFILTTTRDDLSPRKVVESYKNLQEVETLFDDLKHFVDVHPVRHWLETRVRAHVFLCILALLLKRIFEIDCLQGKAITAPLEAVARAKLVNYRVKMSPKSAASTTFWKVTNITPEQQRYFSLVGIRNPASLDGCVWWRKQKQHHV
jgi:transposase